MAGSHHRFADKVIIVTGASSGIGAELARQLAGEGARVALAARDVARLETVANECRERARANGHTTNTPFVAYVDVSEEASCKAMIDAVVAHFGRIDMLVNNAGLGSSGLFEDITDFSIFETLMRVNYLGAVWCTAYALPHLKRTRGLLVGVSSITGLTGVPKRTAYAATKHAMAGFFDSLRIELEDDGVGVTMIYPSFVFSEINQRALSPDGTPYGDRAYKRKQGETMDTDECCRIIVNTMARREREVVMTAQAKIGRFVRLFAPSLIDGIAKRAIARRQ